MAGKKRKKPGPIEHLSAYERIAYECRRCSKLFVSPEGPDPFCKSCRAVLSARAALAPRKEEGT